MHHTVVRTVLLYQGDLLPSILIMMTASMTTSLPACLHKQRTSLNAARSPFFRHSCLLRQPISRQCQRPSAQLDGQNNIRCQHKGPKVSRRTSGPYTPEIVTEEESIPAWKRFAAFLLKSTAVAALAFALVRPVPSKPAFGSSQ